MKSTVKIIESNEDIHASMFEVSRQLEVILSKKRNVFHYDKKITKLTWNPDILSVKMKTGKTAVIDRIILDACNKAEKHGPGSGELLLPFVSTLLSECSKRLMAGDDHREITESLSEACESFLKKIPIATRSLSGKNILNHLESICDTSKERSIIEKALELSGQEGKIFIDSVSSDVTLVELNQGYTFDLAPYEEIVSQSDKWHYKDVKISVIDGFIEKVSEIHGLLEASSKDKTPTVIFCRGVSEEVLATLSLNRMRNTLNVIAVRTPFDEIHANTLKDIAVVSCSNVVSSLQGDLISTIKFDELSHVESVTFSGGKCIIQNSIGQNAALILRDALKTKREKLESDSARELIDQRLRSLTSFYVRIRYDNMINPGLLDLQLRTVKSILRAGFVRFESLEKPDNLMLSMSIQNMINNSRDLSGASTLTLFSAVKYGTQAACSIASIGSVLLLDKD